MKFCPFDNPARQSRSGNIYIFLFGWPAIILVPLYTLRFFTHSSSAISFYNIIIVCDISYRDYLHIQPTCINSRSSCACVYFFSEIRGRDLEAHLRVRRIDIPPPLPRASTVPKIRPWVVEVAVVIERISTNTSSPWWVERNSHTLIDSYTYINLID